MKKIFIIYGILIAAVILLAIYKFSNFNFSFNPFGGGSRELTINNQTYKVDIANDDKSRTVGLSNRNDLAEDRGMLFVFPEKGKYAFWMKEMKFPIDILFINDNKIAEIKENMQPPANPESTNIEIYRPNQEANYVLELKAGQVREKGIKVGDTVELPNT